MKGVHKSPPTEWMRIKREVKVKGRAWKPTSIPKYYVPKAPKLGPPKSLRPKSPKPKKDPGATRSYYKPVRFSCEWCWMKSSTEIHPACELQRDMVLGDNVSAQKSMVELEH